MSVENFAAVDNALRNEISNSIAKSEEAVENLEKVKEQYYNSFWTMKSNHSSLSDEKNPFYEARKSEIPNNQERQKIMRQLDASIKKIEKQLIDTKPEERIQELKKTIASQRIVFAAQNFSFFQHYVNKVVRAATEKSVDIFERKQSTAAAPSA